MAIHNRLGSLSLAAFVVGRAIPTADPNALVALDIYPDVVAMQRGQTVRAKVVARYANGTARDISHEPETRWSSGDTSVLSVTSTGLVMAGDVGVTTVRVEYRGVRSQVIGAIMAAGA
jgi:Bacterial Ig-like domain (group 2)